jgi:pimeloyl-ACP methyl ester carboxylesterase
MNERRVEFNSCGDKVVGTLQLPDGASGKLPLLIMAGGWCYTKEIVMPHYARYFHEIGVGTLLFDYRRFGESEGEPRQHINPWDQVEDYRNAISFAHTLDECDPERLGIWGISYSGGHVLICAASDRRAKWAISTIPVVNGFQTMRRCHGERRFAELLRVIADDRERRFTTGAGGTMPMSSADPDTELSSWPYPHVCRIFNDIKRTQAPRHEHWNTIQSVELLLDYDVPAFCKRIIDTPVMMSVAKGDNITSADLEIETFNAVTNPNKTLDIVEGVSHMSLYSDQDHLAKVGGAQAAWLAELLARRTATPVAKPVLAAAGG